MERAAASALAIALSPKPPPLSLSLFFEEELILMGSANRKEPASIFLPPLPPPPPLRGLGSVLEEDDEDAPLGFGFESLPLAKLAASDERAANGACFWPLLLLDSLPLEPWRNRKLDDFRTFF